MKFGKAKKLFEGTLRGTVNSTVLCGGEDGLFYFFCMSLEEKIEGLPENLLVIYHATMEFQVSTRRR